jgi:transmembrane sensor
MENSNQYKELIVRYLLDELTAEEEADVLKWINSSEQNRKYFEDLKKTWTLARINSVKTINVDEEWRQFEQKIAFKQRGDKQDNESIYYVEEEKSHKKAVLYKIFFKTAVAASLILVLGVGGWFFVKNSDNRGKQLAAVEDNKKREAVTGVVKHVINSSKELKKVVLQDGTEVTLSGHSEVSFNEPFINDRRDITLKGKASFSVAKDKKRPFTVYSGRLSTTALGTRFSVTAFEKENFIVVRLFEGKVVVRPKPNSVNRQENNYYLLPGQELIYNNQQSIARIRRFTGNKVTPKINPEKPFVDSLLIPENEKGSWFMFNNEPLSVVFNELQNMYDIEIVYSKKDISNIYFIGRFNRADSVINILHQIAVPNNLKVAKMNKKFIITR